MEKLVLIDGNSLINRAFYAMPLLITKEGIYTNAVYGFTNMLIKMIETEKPTHIAVAFDVHAPTFRHQLYSEYKGTRKPMPLELRPQIDLLKQVLHALNIKTFEKAGIEADDIIGTIAKNTDVKTIIYTGDKDSFQLVDDSTSVHFTKRGITDIDVYSIDNFKEKMGFDPINIIDLKSLMGDSSDNIKGVAGVGEKSAKDLLSLYKNLDGVYENIDKISGKLKEKLLSGKEDAYFSYKLATIKTDCDIDTSLDCMKVSFPFSKEVKDLFIKLEFKSLYNKDELFGLDEKVKEKKESKTATVSIENLSDFPLIKGKASIYFSENSINVFSEEHSTEYIFGVKHNLFDVGFFDYEILNAIKNLFENNKVIVYSKKDLMHYLKTVNITCELSDIEDLSIMKYLVDFSGEQTGDDMIKVMGLEELSPAYALFTAYIDFEKLLREYNCEKLYREIELPLVEVLFSMENSGFKIDQELLSQTGKEYQQRISELEKQIKELTEEPNLNVNSPMQLGEVLFNKLKIGKGKKTKLGYSTSAEVLEELENSHPVVPVILEYRKIQKLFSTYIEGFKPLIEKNTGLIHTTFNQTLTATGRLSSKDPNLQNIPVQSEEGKSLRKFFTGKSSNRSLISADYSQIELRLLADFSNTESLINAFNSGKDVHSETASKVFNVPLEKVTKNMRRDAKAVNFGIIYGISEYGLAKNIKSSNEKAREYIFNYFKEYPTVKTYIDGNVDFAKNNGYSLTIMNRRRYIREINSSNYNLRQFGARVAMNMPLQGSAADIIKIAMINVFNRLKKENLKSELILQVHDELIIDAYDDEKEKVIKILTEEMENAVKLKVKLTVEVGIGKTWYDAK